MSKKSAYPHLLSPLKLGKHVLKNRMESSNSQPHFIQGPELYPARATFRHYIQRAKEGAAIVTLSGFNDMVVPPQMDQRVDLMHFPAYNMYDGKCQNYIVQFVEALHYYDSLISVGIFGALGDYIYFNEKGEKEIVSVLPKKEVNRMNGIYLEQNDFVDDTVTREVLDKVRIGIGQQCQYLKFLGIDMVTLHMAYRGQVFGQILSPLTNFRTDDYGGDIHGRGKWPVEVMKTIKEVCPDMLIEIELSGDENEEGGNTREEVLEFLRMAEPYLDIVQVRDGDSGTSLPTGFVREENPSLEAAEYIKNAGLDILVACVGGFQDPEHAEAVLAAGKADIISSARAWISNPDYGKLVHEGRSDDIVPCIRCNKCHGRGPKEILATTCSVNPLSGLEGFVEMMGKEPTVKKKVAVIGGGPGGMRTAIYLHERGHEVTLFEKDSSLGGLIRHADTVPFKWPLRNYKNYLIHQMDKLNIDVRLNTAATPEMLGDEYDAVVAAVGSEPLRPRIPGIENTDVLYAIDAISAPERAGERVVVIGGGEVGCETAIVLAEAGKSVTVLEMRSALAADAPYLHYREALNREWDSCGDLKAILGVSCTKLENGCVTYLDADGTAHRLETDTIVLSVGMKAKTDEALTFADSAKEFFMVGDCKKTGCVQSVNRSAYAAASMI